MKCRTGGSARGYLKLLPSTKFGPPEKSYYTEDEITSFPGMISNDYGKGKSVFIPWQIGSQYHFKGHYAHKALFLSALQNLLKVTNSIITDASPLLEITHLANRNGAFEWIGMINHSGQIGASLLQPVVIHNTMIRFKPLKSVKQIMLMRSGVSVTFKQQDGWIECTVPRVGDFEMITCIYD